MSSPVRGWLAVTEHRAISIQLAGAWKSGSGLGFGNGLCWWEAPAYRVMAGFQTHTALPDPPPPH